MRSSLYDCNQLISNRYIRVCAAARVKCVACFGCVGRSVQMIGASQLKTERILRREGAERGTRGSKYRMYDANRRLVGRGPPARPGRVGARAGPPRSQFGTVGLSRSRPRSRSDGSGFGITLSDGLANYVFLLFFYY